MIVDLRIFLQSLIPDIVQSLICLPVQVALEEENFFCFFVGELLLLSASVRVLLTPNFFLFVKHWGGVVPLELVVVVALVPRDTLYEALVVNVEAVAYAVAGLAVLVLLGVYRFHDHLAVLGWRTCDHRDWILCYVVKTLVRKLVQPLGHPEIRVLLDNPYKSIQIIETYETIFIFLNVAQQKKIIFKELFVIHNVKFLSVWRG